MSINIKLKHSSVQDKAPLATDLSAGELALNIHQNSASIYLKDASGAVRKIAAAASANAPSSPATGDTWVDTSATPPLINIWDGASWVGVAGGTITGPTTAGIWERLGTILAPANDGDSLTLHDTGGIPAVQLDAGTSGSPLVRDSNGNLGVGIAAPPLYNANLRTVSFNGTNGVVHDYAVGGTRTGSIITQAAGMQISTQTATPIIFTTDEGGAGGEAARIDKDGKVGIGTASPGAPLHVKSTNPQVIVDSPDASTESRVRFYKNGSSVGQINTTSGNLSILAESALTFSINGGSPSESARIDSAGRLGIGTVAPSRELDVVGVIQSQSSTAGGGMLDAVYAGTTAGNQLGTIRFYGTNPSVTAEATVRAVLEPGSLTGAYIALSTKPASGSATPVERMRIGSDGAIFSFTDTGRPCYTIRSADGASGSTVFIQGLHSASSASTGGLATVYVYTNGDVKNTNNSYGAISDIKLKENIVDAKSQWDDIKGLRLVNYNFKAETGAETHKQLGLIAQEVEQVCPGLVGETKDTDADGKETGEVTKSVAYSVLYMKAVGALQEAMARIEDLEAKVTALEGGSPMKDDSPRSKSRP